MSKNFSKLSKVPQSFKNFGKIVWCILLVEWCEIIKDYSTVHCTVKNTLVNVKSFTNGVINIQLWYTLLSTSNFKVYFLFILMKKYSRIFLKFITTSFMAKVLGFSHLLSICLQLFCNFLSNKKSLECRKKEEKKTI